MFCCFQKKKKVDPKDSNNKKSYIFNNKDNSKFHHQSNIVHTSYLSNKNNLNKSSFSILYPKNQKQPLTRKSNLKKHNSQIKQSKLLIQNKKSQNKQKNDENKQIKASNDYFKTVDSMIKKGIESSQSENSTLNKINSKVTFNQENKNQGVGVIKLQQTGSLNLIIDGQQNTSQCEQVESNKILESIQNKIIDTDVLSKIDQDIKQQISQQQKIRQSFRQSKQKNNNKFIIQSKQINLKQSKQINKQQQIAIKESIKKISRNKFMKVSISKLKKKQQQLQTADNSTINLSMFTNQCFKPSQLRKNIQDSLYFQTFQEAQNSFYCQLQGAINQYSRAIIVSNTPQLPTLLYQKMKNQIKNNTDNKGLTPVQITINKAIINDKFFNLAKKLIYDPQISLEVKDNQGWTPLQMALFNRNIPLVTHIFKSIYNKRQLKYMNGLQQIKKLLLNINDFYLQVDIKVDSFIPLVGSLTPNDTLKITKIKQMIQLDYSLVGYSFPSCKRRKMRILFDGNKLYGINLSKNTICDLLQPLEHDQMVLLVQDLLSTQIRKGQPLIHQINLEKELSLFDNQILQKIGNIQTKKYKLQLKYTSTVQKKKIDIKNIQKLNYLNNYQTYLAKHEQICIKQKNKNKKLQLQVWLGQNFQLKLKNIIHIFELLGVGNTLVGRWSKFLKQKISTVIEQRSLFPIKIDIPLNYSLFFNIQFTNYRHIQAQQYIFIPNNLTKISRSEFQAIKLSKQKRLFFLQAYT